MLESAENANIMDHGRSSFVSKEWCLLFITNELKEISKTRKQTNTEEGKITEGQKKLVCKLNFLLYSAHTKTGQQLWLSLWFPQVKAEHNQSATVS